VAAAAEEVAGEEEVEEEEEEVDGGDGERACANCCNATLASSCRNGGIASLMHPDTGGRWLGACQTLVVEATAGINKYLMPSA
jgi:hypothetical protein